MDSQVVLMLDADLLGYLSDKGLSINDFALLVLVDKGNYGLLEVYNRAWLTIEQKIASMQGLVRKQLCTSNGGYKLSDYRLTEEGSKIIAETSTRTNVLELITGLPQVSVKTELDSFVDRYLELFPKSVRNGGNKVLRSNTTDVKAKMLKFMNKYKHSQETILKATENYLARCRGVYTYCPTSEYFILKDGSSALATECDAVHNGGNDELINPFEKRM